MSTPEEIAREIVGQCIRYVPGQVHPLVDTASLGERITAALAASEQRVRELERQVADWKMHAYDHGYQP